MTRAVALELGARYAFSRKSTVSFVSVVAIAGLALSVAVLVIVTSVINGMEREFRERIFGMLPHLTLYGRSPFPPLEAELERLRSLPGVRGAAPVVQRPGLAAVSHRVTGVLITGIDGDYGSVSDLFEYVEDGNGGLTAGEFGLLAGAGVAATLGVEVGDSVTLVLPGGTVTPAGLIPRQKRFQLRGIVRSRSEVDAQMVYVHLADARRLFRLGRNVEGYQLRVADPLEVERVALTALGALSDRPFVARSWIHTHGHLYHAIGVQKTTMFVLLSFLIGVAAFNLVSTLVMVVDQRRGDVAILRTLGSDSGTIIWAFLLLGTTLAGIGIGAGLLVGAGITLLLPGLYEWLSATFSVELMSQYFVHYLPVQIRLADLLGIGLTALVLAMLATVYPAWRAARLRPSEVLAHE